MKSTQKSHVFQRIFAFNTEKFLKIFNNNEEPREFFRQYVCGTVQTHTATLTSPVCLAGTKRSLFSFHTFLYHYNHQKCSRARSAPTYKIRTLLHG